MDFDLYSLRIFTRIHEEGSFSKAALALGLTQPTVSQQVARLEEKLGAKVFERVGHRVVLTHTGHDLLSFSFQMLQQSDDFYEKVSQSKVEPIGVVRYSMPESCQWTPHYRYIMSQIKHFPMLTFEIGIHSSEVILTDLLEGRIDFGFIVGERLHPELRFEKFADEHYSAVASIPSLLKQLESGDFKNLRLVAYPGWEIFFTTWAKANGMWKSARERLHTPTVKVGTLAGAIHATQEGAGVAILPTHCIRDEIALKQLQVSRIQNAKSTNPIYITKRIGTRLTKRSEIVLEMLKDAKKRIG